jgi:hypothetical protein
MFKESENMKIPNFLLEQFEQQDFSCTNKKCKSPFILAGLVFLGIKTVRRNKQPAKDFLFCQYICPKCNEAVGFEIFEMKLEEFAMMVLQDVEDSPNKPAKAKSEEIPQKDPKVVSKVPKAKSKMTIEEQNTCVQMLDDSKSWADWLKKIGIPVEPKENKDSKGNFSIDRTEGDNE